MLFSRRFGMLVNLSSSIVSFVLSFVVNCNYFKTTFRLFFNAQCTWVVDFACTHLSFLIPILLTGTVSKKKDSALAAETKISL